MKIRHCRSQEQFTVIVPGGGTLFLFDPDEKELVKAVIEGMQEMDPEKGAGFAPILYALTEKGHIQ